MSPLTVYSTPTCRPCKAAKDRLDDDGISYTSVDLTEDAGALAELKETLNTPTIQTPLFLWRGEHHTMAGLPKIRREAAEELSQQTAAA